MLSFSKDQKYRSRLIRRRLVRYGGYGGKINEEFRTDLKITSMATIFTRAMTTG